MVEKLIISKNRVKIYLQKLDLRVSDNFYEALNEAIKELLSKAAERAKKNGRSTTMAHDI